MTENEILNEIRGMNQWIVKKLHAVLIVLLTGRRSLREKREFEDRQPAISDRLFIAT